MLLRCGGWKNHFHRKSMPIGLNVIGRKRLSINTNTTINTRLHNQRQLIAPMEHCSPQIKKKKPYLDNVHRGCWTIINLKLITNLGPFDISDICF